MGSSLRDLEEEDLVVLHRGGLALGRDLRAALARHFPAAPPRLLVLPQGDCEDGPGAAIGAKDGTGHSLRLPGGGGQHMLLQLERLVDGFRAPALVSGYAGEHCTSARLAFSSTQSLGLISCRGRARARIA